MTATYGQAAARVVAWETRAARTPVEVAAAVARACEKIARHLAPLVGETGIRTLFDRSLTLNQRQFPWLPGPSTRPDEPPWTGLCVFLEERPVEEGRGACASLLDCGIGLLAELIGEGVVDRLMPEIWPEVFAGEW